MARNTGYQSRLELACEPSASWYARAHSKAVFSEWGLSGDLAYDALTIVGELVSNATRHAGGDAQPFSEEQGQPKVRLCALALVGLPQGPGKVVL